MSADESSAELKGLSECHEESLWREPDEVNADADSFLCQIS
jgi:hypothetical protein